MELILSSKEQSAIIAQAINNISDQIQYTASQVMEKFNFTRSQVAQLPKTLIKGRSSPLYTGKTIRMWNEKHTELDL